MESGCCSFTYEQTGFYNTIVTDYVKAADSLRPFYVHPVTKEGVISAIYAREQFPTDRQTLVTVLRGQYQSAKLNGAIKVDANIELLLQENTFSICTAHQPNIFTGYLYFIYKILHAVKLAEHFKKDFPQYNFVPVYYMGSEDADLEELGKVFLNGEKLIWDTNQTGAVGRMKTAGLQKLINRISGELSVWPHGIELIRLLQEAYIDAPDIQTASFRLLHKLFESYGLLVLIADDPRLKKAMLPVFEEDIFKNKSSEIVTATTKRLAEKYKVQANPREINLFYLKDALRNRIERLGEGFVVVDTDIRFSEAEIKEELRTHPERFSPNVILRGLYQETILPNISFIGGGGELAYWLELKDLFEAYKVPYPMQVLRNSFALISRKSLDLQEKLGIEAASIFSSEQDLLQELVNRNSALQIHLSNEIRDAAAFYQHVSGISEKVDTTLVPHVASLQKKMIRQLHELEKKLLRAEKRKFDDSARQIRKFKSATFPNNNLQERVENFMPYYAMYGKDFLQWIYDASLTLEQKFVVQHLPAVPQLSN